MLLSLRRVNMRLVFNATTYTPVELLGPCFKTGRTVASFINSKIYFPEREYED